MMFFTLLLSLSRSAAVINQRKTKTIKNQDRCIVVRYPLLHILSMNMWKQLAQITKNLSSPLRTPKITNNQWTGQGPKNAKEDIKAPRDKRTNP